MRRILASMAMSELEQMPRVGYWRSPEEPGLPDPGDFVDASWDAAEQRKVIEYLDQAYQVPMFAFGPSWCRMGCAGVPNDIGTQDLTDGVWLFPEGLVHYVRHHAVRPPEAFLQHLRGRDFRHSDLPTVEPGRMPVMDLGSFTRQEPPIEDHEYLLFVQCCPDPGDSLDDRAIDGALGVPDYGTRAPHRWYTETWTEFSPLDALESRRHAREYVILSDDPRVAFDLLRPLLESAGLLDVSRAAYRRREDAATCQMLWPEGDAEPFEPIFEDV
jgi:hypothetical protein